MADEGISAGSVHIDASLRAARDFWTRFIAENTAGASKAGDDLGDRIGKAISARIAKGVREGVDAGGADLGSQGTRAGNEYSGKFADTLRARLDAALRNLPTPTIGAATTEAEQKIRDLRNSLDKLRNQRINIDISDTAALAEVRRIQAEVTALGSRSPSIQVRTDAAAAAAELAAVSAEADHVGRSASGASSRMGMLVTAGLTIGPAIVPGAAAAAGAILGIGVAASSVLAGIGVGALAFHGVGDAVKALNTAQQDAAKTGSTLVGQQKQLAAGADQVRTAEASLANTRANAADSLRRASQQITTARRSETTAVQEALRAQRDLNDAREKEKRDQQDLAASIEGNALAQRQAVLDVAAAQQTLASAGTEQNRINFEQATLRQKELLTQGRRLAEQKALDDRTGIEGSKQVVTALTGVAAANQRVADAQQATRDATAQAATAQRQALFQIAQASQAVETAQRSAGAATVSAAATGGSAIDALQKSMDKLSPSGQAFARFLYGLKGNVDALKASAQGGILPGAQEAIATLLPYFGSLNTFVADVSNTLGTLEVRAAHTFTNPFWRQFFGFIGSQAVPNLVLMYQAGVNVAEGFARIVQQFAPVERQVGHGILTLTQGFVDWSRSLDQNQGFQRFVQFVQTEGPHVLSTIGALATAGLHIVEAYGPIGSVVVTELRLLSQIISAIPVPIVTALAAAITAYKVASLATAGVQSALNSGLVGTIGSMVRYKVVTDAAGTSTTGLQRSASSAASILGGGAFTAALGVATLAISFLLSKQAESKAQFDALKAAVADYGRALKDGVNAQSIESAKSILAQNIQLRGLVDTTQKAGLSSADLAAGLNGEVTARQKVVDAIENQITLITIANATASPAEGRANRKKIEDLQALERAFVETNANAAEANRLSAGLAAEQADVGKAVNTVRSAFTGANTTAATYGDSLAAVSTLTGDVTAKSSILALTAESVAKAHLSAAAQAGLFGQVLDGLGKSATTSGPIFDNLARTFGSIAGSSLDAKVKVELLNRALEQMYGNAISQVEADEKLVRTQSDLSTQLNTSSAGFDLNKGKQRANTVEILANRDALEAALLAARDKYVQDVANGTAEETARAQHDKTTKTILDQIAPVQRNSAAVKDLNEKYGQIPPSKTTSVSTPGLDKAIDDLITAHAVQLGLDQTPPWTKDQIASEANFLRATVNGQTGRVAITKAEGGAVYGPGTGTSDDVPAFLPETGTRYRLSNDEHIWTAAEVKAAGGHSAVETLRAQVLRGFASGGPVSARWPIEILPTLKNPVDLAALWARRTAAQAALTAQSGITPAGADLDVGRTILQAAQALKADHKVLLSAFETALVESGLRNLPYGDRDSLGVFQQRPSQGWGTAAEVLNVDHAARSYLVRAIANEPRYTTAGQLAQSVQRSAFPGKYDQRAGDAEAIIAALSGASSGFGVSAGGQEAIKQFIRSTDPLPYQFGAAGPGGYDCSGISSAVYGLITGRGGGHGQRYFTTFDFASTPPAGFIPGPGGTFTVGVNPTTHMAGNYGGLGFEAASTATGIKIGASARPTSAFQKQFHMATGGPVNADLLEQFGLDIGGDASGMTVNGRKIDRRLFDLGGVIPQGLSLMDNHTSAPELAAVLNSDQLDRFGAPAPVHITISPKDGAMRDLMDLIDVRVEHGHDRVAAAVGSGMRD